MVEGVDDTYTISHIMNKYQVPVEAWDLHVGCKLDVLGRTVTLMQASLKTKEWLNKHRKKYVQQKARYIKELEKYDEKYAAKHAKVQSKKNGYENIALRNVMNEIDELHVQLAKFRPKIAQSIQNGKYKNAVSKRW